MEPLGEQRRIPMALLGAFSGRASYTIPSKS